MTMRDDAPTGDVVEQHRAVDPADVDTSPGEEPDSTVSDGAVPATTEADPADIAEDRRIEPPYADEEY